MTLVLGLDCALGSCSVALVEDTHVLAFEHLSLERGHSEALMPMTQAVLAAADRTYRQISVVAATVGPGSFTGVRIGLAAARGMALAMPADTVAVTTLEAIAAAAVDATTGRDDCPLLVAIDTKRGDTYAQWFDAAAKPTGAAAVSTIGTLVDTPPARRIRVAGDAAAAVAHAAAASGLQVDIVEGARVPDARIVARLAAVRYAASGGSSLSPLYLRKPEVGR